MSPHNDAPAPRSLLHAVTHPVSTAAFGVGVVKGAASSILRAASCGGGPAHAEWVAPQGPIAEEAAGSEEPTLLLGDHLEAAEGQAPGTPGEQFATESTAVTRTSAHGGGGRDEEIDDWYGEGADADSGPTGVVESLEAGDDLPAEAADLKAILSDAETLRRAAERDR